MGYCNGYMVFMVVIERIFGVRFIIYFIMYILKGEVVDNYKFIY